MEPVLLTGLPPNETAARRLAGLAKRMEAYRAGSFCPAARSEFVNNHIHTCYSFSPYSPSEAAYAAWYYGLPTAGIMDHDSVCGAAEFIEAAKILGIAATVGFECRCSMAGTPFEKLRLNNPDEVGNAYVACHGIPHQNLAAADEWLAPLRKRRNERNRKMVQRLNALLGDAALELDFDRDVLPLSMAEEGGSVTERHLLYALALKVTGALGKGHRVLDFLKARLGIEANDRIRDALLDADNPAYEYSLLGVFKSGLVERFYLSAADECPPIGEFTAFARSIGAVPAYAYLGDVGNSVTGDKKAQAFEDAFLDELVPWLAGRSFCSVTYMPTRNTPAQLQRIMQLCEENGLFQISGEDINSPSQSFICAALARPEYRHLIQSTWALIGHEKVATNRLQDGMFTEETLTVMPSLEQRVKYFEQIGRT